MVWSQLEIWFSCFKVIFFHIHNVHKKISSNWFLFDFTRFFKGLVLAWPFFNLGILLYVNCKQTNFYIPNSSHRNNNNLNHDTVDDDPMAAMLDNNAKNNKAANIFVNKLHGLVSTSEYAEVSHSNVMEHRTSSQGPYATTNLIEPSNVRENFSFLSGL